MSDDHWTLASGRRRRREEAPGLGPRVPGPRRCPEACPPPASPVSLPGQPPSSPLGHLASLLQPGLGVGRLHAAHLAGSVWASVSHWSGPSHDPHPAPDIFCRGRAGAVLRRSEAVAFLPVARRPVSRTSNAMTLVGPALDSGSWVFLMTAGSWRGWEQGCHRSPQPPSPAPSCAQERPTAATAARASCRQGARDGGREARAGGWPGRPGWTRRPVIARSKQTASLLP